MMQSDSVEPLEPPPGSAPGEWYLTFFQFDLKLKARFPSLLPNFVMNGYEIYIIGNKISPSKYK